MCSTSFEFTVPVEYDRKSAKEFLRKYCGLTAETVKLCKYRENGITRAEETLRTVDTVYQGDIIKISLPTDRNNTVPVEGNPEVLLEDRYLLIVNKPASMPVHPVKIHQLDTLSNIVSFYQKQRGEDYTFRSLYRLDKDTSGVVVIAKDRVTLGLLHNKIEKEYIAVCEGIIEEAGTVDLPIANKEGSIIVREVRADGQPAVTHYKPLSYGNKHTLLSLQLETGRTHQIRCHLSFLGHPLAGDDLYGGSLEYISRQALHCKTVSFTHPFTKKKITIDTAIPAEFLHIIA